VVVIDALIQRVEFDSETALQVYPESRADQQAFCLRIIPIERKTTGARRASRSRRKSIGERDSRLYAKMHLDLRVSDSRDRTNEQDNPG
jgi:hypothetical protein